MIANERKKKTKQMGIPVSANWYFRRKKDLFLV